MLANGRSEVIMILDLSLSFILGLITYSIHVLFKYNEARARYLKVHKRSKFKFSWYLENNITRLIVSLLAYIALFILVARLDGVSLTFAGLNIGRAGFMYIFTFLAGYSSDSVFRNLIKVIGKNWESKVGGVKHDEK